MNENNKYFLNLFRDITLTFDEYKPNIQQIFLEGSKPEQDFHSAHRSIISCIFHETT